MYFELFIPETNRLSKKDGCVGMHIRFIAINIYLYLCRFFISEKFPTFYKKFQKGIDKIALYGYNIKAD